MTTDTQTPVVFERYDCEIGFYGIVYDPADDVAPVYTTPDCTTKLEVRAYVIDFIQGSDKYRWESDSEFRERNRDFLGL